MIKVTTRVRCDRCGRVHYTSEGNIEKVKETFRAYGWTFPDTRCYCRECSKEEE